MALTTAQLTTLKNDILADPVLNAFPNNSDGNEAIADLYNAQANPAFTVWRTLVSWDEIGDTVNATELGALTTDVLTKILTFKAISGEGMNPSQGNRRTFWNQIFASGTTSRTALTALWKRTATRAEKLLANTLSGDGTNANPARLTFEGELLGQDVELARQ